MAFDFPNSPAIGDTAQSPTGIYSWDGAKWTTDASVGAASIWLPVVGGTMTGPLTLARDPLGFLEAATKRYVDAHGVVSFNTRTGAVVLIAADVSGASGLLTSGGTMTGNLTLRGDPTAPLHAATKQYVDNNFPTLGAADARYVNVTGDTMTGALTVNSTINASSDIDAAGNLNAAGVVNGAYVYSSGDIYAVGNVTGANGTVHGAYVSSGGDIGATNTFTGAQAILSSVLGVNYSAFDGYWKAFGYNGYINVYLNGGYWGDLWNVGQLDGRYKAIGAYTPNQSVDVWANPTFSNVYTNWLYLYSALGMKFTNFASNFVAFGWNGRVQCWIDGGGAYVELRDTRDYTPNQSVDVSSNPTFGTVYSQNNVSAGGWGITFPSWGGYFYGHGWDGRLQWYLQGGFYGYVTYSPGGVAYHGSQLYVDGSHNAIIVQLNGSYHYVATTYSSDRRLKSNIRPATVDALALINSIPVYECDIRHPSDSEDDRTTHWEAAVIADDLEKLIPHAVVYPEPTHPDTRGERYAGIRELPLVTTLIRAVQQLTARVEAIEGIIT